MRSKITNALLLVSIFLLPWQTRFIFETLVISGEPSPFGVLALHAAEVLIVAVYLLRGRAQHTLHGTKIMKALFIFLAVGFFSISLSGYSTIGWYHMLHALSAAFLFSILLDQRTDTKKVIIAFASGLLIPVGIGAYQVALGHSGASTLLGLASKDALVAGVAVVETSSGRMLRAYGSFPHPNIFGGYLATALVLLAWLARFAKNRFQLVLLGIPVVVLSSGLIMTFSRGAWFGMIAAGLVLIALMLWQRKMPPSRAIPLFTLGLVTVLITLGVFHNQLIARFNPELRVEATSIEERVSQYTTFNDVFFTSALLGVGPGAYVFALSDVDPGYEVWSYQPVHNVFLLIMAELGIIGFLLGGYWIVKIDRPARRHWNTAGGTFTLALGICLLFIGFFDHYLWSLWPGLALSALCLAIMTRWGERP